jgi:uncharacterized protein YegP (UPF0339 family)
VSDPIYKADDGWRWRFKAANNEIIAASTEAFTERRHAVENMKLAKDALTFATDAIELIDVEEDE